MTRARPWPWRRGAAPDAREQVALLFERCERRVGRYLVQFVGDRSLAEDLLQETFAVACRSFDEVPPANPEAWLFGIARNRALAALRRRRRLEQAVSRLITRPQVIDEEQTVLAIRDLLERTLDPSDRSLLLLRYLHDFDATELAEMTSLTPAAVRQRLSRARRKLIAAASDHEGDDS